MCSGHVPFLSPHTFRNHVPLESLSQGHKPGRQDVFPTCSVTVQMLTESMNLADRQPLLNPGLHPLWLHVSKQVTYHI